MKYVNPIAVTPFTTQHQQHETPQIAAFSSSNQKSKINNPQSEIPPSSHARPPHIPRRSEGPPAVPMLVSRDPVAENRSQTIMDVAYFLRSRVEFIRQFYYNGSETFVLRKAKIENEEEPYVPAYSEDGVPPFLAEWQEAEDSLQVLGYACLSMLSASLKLYLSTVGRLYGYQALENCKGKFKKGFISGYRDFFETELGIDFSSAPCDLELLEEVVWIRNAFEHPTEIVFHQISHPFVEQKSPSMFFCNEHERAAWDDIKDIDDLGLSFPPRVHVTKEGLFKSLDGVSRFCEWLDDQLTKRRHGITDFPSEVIVNHNK